MTKEQKEALAVLVEVAGMDDFTIRHGRIVKHGEQKTAADIAAKACGMVHRDGHLLTRVPAAIQLRGRHWVPDDCLINSL
ncbi:MAG: hypothetical protein V4671_15830 [Armatimonadota bacterium]